jgi:hypothetical protein
MAKTHQKICIYCSYLYQKAKIEGAHPDVLPQQRKVWRSCLACQVALSCIDYFDVFHGWDDDDGANQPVNGQDETESEEDEEPFNEEVETV